VLTKGQGEQAEPTNKEGQWRGVRICPLLAEPTEQEGQRKEVRIHPPLAEPTDKEGQRMGVRIRPPLGGDDVRHKEDKVMTPKQFPVRQDVETSQESGRSGRGFDQPLSSCMRRSWKGPLKVRFKDAENQEKGEDPVFGGGPELVPEQEQPKRKVGWR
jgi:hypothetical protein